MKKTITLTLEENQILLVSDVKVEESLGDPMEGVPAYSYAYPLGATVVDDTLDSRTSSLVLEEIEALGDPFLDGVLCQQQAIQYFAERAEEYRRSSSDPLTPDPKFD